MALQIDELSLPITPEDALNIVRAHTNKMGVFLDLDRIYELIGILSMECRDIRTQLRSMSANMSLNVDNKEDIVSSIVSLGIPRRELMVDGKVTLNATVLGEVMNQLSEGEDAYEFIKTYLKYASNKNRIGNLNGYAKLPRSAALSFNNHRMVLAKPSWRLLSTSRLQAFDPGIQGLARTFGDVITYPKGYILIRADSSQIEPRINFSYFIRDDLIVNLIKFYGDAYFGILHYCLMSEDMIQQCRHDFDKVFKPIEITDEMQENRQQTKRMVNAGSYGSQHLDRVDPRLAKAFDERLVKHPARKEAERKVMQIVESNPNPTFYSAFGTPITPDETTRYSKGSDAWRGHLLRCGINNPVQATASDLMICSVNAANNLLKGFRDSAICYYKHDEGAFLVSEKDAEGTDIVEQLSDITAYNVKGWVPIPADPIIGIKKPELTSYL